MKPSVGYFCLLALYFLWGSTYMGIRLSVETIPPLVVGMLRHGFGAACLLLLLIKSAKLRKLEIRNALFVGSLTAGISNGALTWAEVNVPSSYASIAFTTMPLFLLIFNFFAFERVKPTKLNLLAICIGLFGVGLVVTNGEMLSGGSIKSWDLFLLVLCPSLWAFGSLLGRKLEMPKNILLSSAFQMLGGATLLTILAFLHGDFRIFHFADVSSRSFAGIVYLAIGGSLLGYSAFAVAIKSLEPQVAGTYAFVAPIVAMALGYLFNEQVLRPPILVGSALAILSVVLTFYSSRISRRKKKTP